MTPALGTAAGIAVISALALRYRSRFYATYVLVFLSVLGLCALGMRAALPASFGPLLAYLLAAAFVHSASLVWARPRSLLFRVLVTWPGLFFVAGTLLGFPWAIAAAIGHPLPWPLLPYAIALVGVLESVSLWQSEVDVVVDRRDAGELVRRHAHGDTRVDRPLRLVQITDPHLGPFMSKERLRRISERAVARDPDLVLLTGDFLTMESQQDASILGDALAPLAALEGRVFACRGNHDHESPRVVAEALARAGVRLLNDTAEIVETPAGPVQIVGLDFAWRERRERMDRVFEAHPRRDGHFRLVLLHDPGAFRELAEGEADLVLSGHTHGGHVGFLRLGLTHTFVSMFTSIPDHGFFARGRDRLYVHRGTGHYGFPLRVGVPGEESLLRVHKVYDA
jgi:predicted MPP superfamily phosphohydrolase